MPAGQHPRMGALSLGIFSKGNLMTFNSIAQANALPTEHKIGFAYPSSERAKNLGHEATGCFTVEVAVRDRSAETVSLCKQRMALEGLTREQLEKLATQEA